MKAPKVKQKESFWEGIETPYFRSIERFTEALELPKIIKDKKGMEYLNVPCSFDIETSSFYIGEDKCATMYIWMFGFNGKVCIGRTWYDFIRLLDMLQAKFELSDKRTLLCYCHNLSYEFQFLRKWLNWTNIFAANDRKPMKAVCDKGIEFRCSYILTNKSLAKVGKDLTKYKIEKMVGDLDYSLIRHSATEMSEKELGYCINDVKVVMAHIQECIEAEGNNITRIPLTNTGYVRKFARKCCLSHDVWTGKPSKYKWYSYRGLMERLTLDPEEYKLLKAAFQGGFTHASAWWSGITLHNVRSYDFTSSYPSILINSKFPMSKGEKHNVTSLDDFNHSITYYCCVFTLELFNVKEKLRWDHPISASKCTELENAVYDNGRIVSADHLVINCTEYDYLLYKKWYNWDNMTVSNMYRYMKGYLPKSIVECILKLYSDKTQLKGVKGREVDYAHAKALLNSVYGMCVTDIARGDVTYSNDEWSVAPVDVNKCIKQYNESKKRFLFYPWGVYTTSIARFRLFTAIEECGSDYVYSDTDSVKILNWEKHQEYFEKYNETVIQANHDAMDHHHLDYSLTEPKTIEGESKPLGVWDYDGDYDTFRTIGAKRYMVEKHGEISLTVSGLNKGETIPYLLDTYSDPFDAFDDNLYIPKGKTGKKIHTYVDEELYDSITDYTGVKHDFHELSCVHMEEADYSLSIPIAYFNYLKGLREEVCFY